MVSWHSNVNISFGFYLFSITWIVQIAAVVLNIK